MPSSAAFTERVGLDVELAPHVLQVHLLVGLQQPPGFGVQRNEVRLADAELAAQLPDHRAANRRAGGRSAR